MSRRRPRKRLAPPSDPAPLRKGQAEQPAANQKSKAVRFSLLYLVPPILLGASLADWACHRYSRIEQTAGAKESLIHIVLLGEMGIPVLATVFLEITSPAIMTMFAGFLVHELTVYGDLRLAVSKREVTPVEQTVRSVMEMIPSLGAWLVNLLKEDELRALLGVSLRDPDFSIRLES